MPIGMTRPPELWTNARIGKKMTFFCRGVAAGRTDRAAPATGPLIARDQQVAVLAQARLRVRTTVRPSMRDLGYLGSSRQPSGQRPHGCAADGSGSAGEPCGG